MQNAEAWLQPRSIFLPAVVQSLEGQSDPYQLSPMLGLRQILWLAYNDCESFCQHEASVSSSLKPALCSSLYEA